MQRASPARAGTLRRSPSIWPTNFQLHAGERELDAALWARGLEARNSFRREGASRCGCLGFRRDQYGARKISTKARQKVELIMITGSHFLEHKIMQSALGKEPSEPGWQ